MIYFVQRKKDDAIYMATTTDLQRELSRLQYKYGEIDLLGVMPGDDTVLHDLWQRHGIYKLEGEDEWLICNPDVLDFIYRSATLEDDSHVKASARYRTSDYTPIKQQALRDALDQQINLIVNITKTWDRPKPYLYFDLNAGPGITEKGQPGSPVIFQRIAEKYSREWSNFRYQATLYEADLHIYKRLVEVLGQDHHFEIKNSDHESLRERLETDAKMIIGKKRDWVFGAVYADPSNAVLPWELLERLNEVYPRIDVMINIACASYKRTIATIGYQTLAERLPRIKKHWIVRKPFGKHQWSILIGSNWTNYPAWREKNFYPWDDNDVGSSIFEKLVYTPEQVQKRYQPQLPLKWNDE